MGGGEKGGKARHGAGQAEDAQGEFFAYVSDLPSCWITGLDFQFRRHLWKNSNMSSLADCYQIEMDPVHLEVQMHC